MEFINIILIILWWIIGVIGYIYWWVKEFDFTDDNLLPTLIAGLLGPFTWINGYLSYKNRNKEPEVLIKKRK